MSSRSTGLGDPRLKSQKKKKGFTMVAKKRKASALKKK